MGTRTNLGQIGDYVGVSKTAVSLYINDPNTTRVGEDTKRRIDEAIRTLSFRPNVLARSLSTKKSQAVGIVIPYNGPLFGSSFLNRILSGIQETFFQNAYSIVFLPTSGNDSPSIVEHQLGVAGGYDGLVLFGTRYCSLHDMQRNVSQMEKSGIPFVTLNVPVVEGLSTQVILRDKLEANAIEYLLSLGHRDIVLMGGRKSTPDTMLAERQYRASLENASVQFRPELVLYGDYERSVADSELSRAMHSGIKFSAVACLSDTMAIGVYSALKRSGLNVPDDVSVVGKHDSFFADCVDPPLTTVRTPGGSAGRKAAELLLECMDGAEPGRKISLDSELVVRASTRVHR